MSVGVPLPEDRILVEVGERILERILASRVPGLRLRIRPESPEIRVSLGIARANLEIGGIDGKGRLVLLPRGAAAFLTRALGGAVRGGRWVSVEEGRILVTLLPPDFPFTLERPEVTARAGSLRLVSILST